MVSLALLDDFGKNLLDYIPNAYNDLLWAFVHAMLEFLFLLNAYHSGVFECSHIFKKLILICISKKNESLTIATHIMCLIYMISMHFSHKNSTNPTIYAKYVECDFFPLPSKFEIRCLMGNHYKDHYHQ
jgi:hypothetical protein